MSGSAAHSRSTVRSRRGAALISAIVLLIVVSVLAACVIPAITIRTASRIDRVERLRANAAAVAGEHLALWKAKQDATIQSNLSTVVAKNDTSFKSKPLITITTNIGGATCVTEIWPGATALRLRSVGKAGGCFVERWTEWPIKIQ